MLRIESGVYELQAVHVSSIGCWYVNNPAAFRITDEYIKCSEYIGT